MASDAFSTLCPAVVELLPQAIVIWRLDDPDDDASLRLLGANRAASALAGFELTPFLGKRLVEVFPQAAPVRQSVYGSAVRAGVRRHLDEVDYGEGASRVTVRIEAVPLADRCLAVMAESISDQRRGEAEVRRLNAFLDAIIDNMPAMVFVKDAEHLRFELFNRAGEELLGLSRADLMGKNDHDFFPREQAEFFVSKDREVLRDGRMLEILEEPIDTAHGQRWLHTRKIPIGDERDGAPRHLLGISVDVTERRRVAESLRRANDQLEAFSYSVAHDLRSPLRGINGFARALLEDCADQLDESGQDYLRRIAAAAERMGELIDALLVLSRVTRTELQSEPLDLTALARSVAAYLRAASPQRQVTLTVAEGLAARGDAALVRSLLDNLLGNAWKFTGENEHARIELGARQEGAETVFFVRDNGVGFDMAYAAKLFAPFQRLHAAKEYPGTGIGLATVQRIVERHGGRVWAESTPGRGATFNFTLPTHGHS